MTSLVKPYWARACCSNALRGRGTILGYVPDPNPGTPNTAIVTFQYTDFQCAADALLPAQLLLPAGPLVQLPNCRWRVYGVPYDSYIAVLMRTVGGAAQVVTMHFRGAATRCRFLGDITNLEPNYEMSGAECLQFDWDADGSFPYGYTYALYRLAAQNVELLVTSGTVGADQTSINFTGLQPTQLYRFVLQGVCNPVGPQTGPDAVTVAITAPGPALGTDFTVTNITDAGEGIATVTLTYGDYYCVTDVVLTSPTPGVTVASAGEGAWTLSNVPYSSTVALTFSATVDTVSCPCVTAGTLTTTAQLHMPAPPVTPCGSIAITGLVNTAATATCLSFTWARHAELVKYSWVLLDSGGDIVASGEVPQSAPSVSPSVIIPNLQPASTYTMEVVGTCQSGGGTPEATLPDVATAAAVAPVLPDFGATEGDAIDFVPAGPGLFTVYVTYGGWSCVSVPQLTVASPVSFATSYLGGNRWAVNDVPAGAAREQCIFSAAPLGGVCTSNCAAAAPGADELQTPPFFFTVPTAPCTPLLPAQIQVAPAGATCVTINWTLPAGTYASFRVMVRRHSDGAVVAARTTTAATYAVTLTAADGIAASTQYDVSVTPTCVVGGVAPSTTVAVTTPAAQTPALEPIPDQSDNWVYDAESETYALTFTYPVAGAQCLTDLELMYAPPTAPGTYGPISARSQVGSNYTWRVPASGTRIAAAASVTLALSGALGTCGCAGAGLPPPVIQTTLTAPNAPPPPPPVADAAPYKLTITNYGGPPKLLTEIGVLAGTSASDPAFTGAGGVTVSGSYLNQWHWNDQYAFNIVTNFLQYNAQQRQFTYTTSPYSPLYGETKQYHLPVAAIYYGVTGDPCTGQFSTPYMKHPGEWYAIRGYSFADSQLGGPDPAPINPGMPFRNFAYPPMLAFFVRLITYNWNVVTAQAGFTNNIQQVQLALTVYGSKNPAERWWFNASVNGGTGVITTPAPADPSIVPSIINGIANDGGNDSAGWNAMERWFMYAAYCNQCLRQLIDAGEIVAADGTSVMTLEDIGVGEGKVLPTCCQISAITADGEGNGFQNTTDNLFVPPSNNPNYTASATQQAACNAAIVALWDKWLNQSTAEAGTPPGWPTVSAGLFPNAPAAWTTANLFAPAPRVLMPATPFTLPCALSMTTTGLIPKMAPTDLGAASGNFSAVNAMFPEIYDTSDSKPFCFLGAGAGGKTFTPEMHEMSTPKKASDPFASNPALFAATYGVWDNLVGTGRDLPPFLCDGTNPSAGTGSATAFNDLTLARTPLMQTSACTPWGLSTSAANPLVLYFAGSNGDSDSAALAWALESSRYDLYNGAWAAAIGNGAVDYSAVTQGVGGVDGAAIWADLSTGLKPRVAATIVNMTPAAATRCIWMLSTQSGPFVNNMGVRHSARGGDVAITPADLLTFGCPDARLSSGDPWPGWTNMQGQWCGPGTKANAGVMQRYALDQMFNGVTYAIAQNGTPLTVPTTNGTGSTENNFGVFHDMGIIAAAWARMATDMRGATLGSDGQPISKNGIVGGSGACPYTADVDVNLGCYELAFLPLSWFNPTPLPYPDA